MAGDFNLHSTYWEEEVNRTDQRADELLEATADKNLKLLNTDGTPTWTQSDKSSVLDLAFVSAKLAQVSRMVNRPFWRMVRPCPFTHQGLLHVNRSELT